jgi:hypothetical protein
MLLKERQKGREEKEEDVSRKTRLWFERESTIPNSVENSFGKDYGPVAGRTTLGMSI